MLEWCLPRFGSQDYTVLRDWQTAEMNHDMTDIMSEKQWKPGYYCPSKGVVSTGNHMCRLYGAMLARAVSGNLSIIGMWDTRSSLRAVGVIQESLTQTAFKDLCRCTHFADDWEADDERWSDMYPSK